MKLLLFYRPVLWVLSLLFLFSGFVKLNDPMGTAIKLEEYFAVFAADGLSFFDSLRTLSLFFSLLLIVMEVVLGVALLIGYRLRTSLWISFGLLMFFTCLTFYSAYFEKVTDCGCFGDAIKLTPWQSFSKDVLLLVLTVGVIVARRVDTSLLKIHVLKIMSNIRVRRKDLLIGGVICVTFGLGMYAVLFLPFIDFRVYKIGAHIPSLRKPSEVPRYGYIFRKNDEEYVLKAYTTDSSYEFVGTKLLNPESLPKIKDYAFWNDEGDATRFTLTANKLLVVVHKAEEVSESCAEAIDQLLHKLPQEVVPLVVTSSTRTEYEAFRQRASQFSALPYYFSDATLLKTMLRTNPGLMLLQEGTVRAKWSKHSLPDVEDIQAVLH